MERSTLRVTSGDSEVAVQAGETYVVGRSRAADLFIDDSRVSRRHLIIEATDAGWAARDLSTNGTWIDSQRVQTVDIRGRICLRLGTPTGPEVVVTAGPPESAHDAVPTVRSAVADPTSPLVGTPAGGSGPVDAPVPLAGDRHVGHDRPDPTASVGRPASTARRRRRWPWVTLVVLLLVVAAVDRIAAVLATHQIVDQVQKSEELTSKPGATISGFPFLTQVASGRYSDVSVTIHDLTTSGPRIDRIVAHLQGVHIPLSAAISGKVKRVPVDKISASVFVAFSNLNSYLNGLPGGLQLGSSGSTVRLTGQIPGLDQALGALLTANIGVQSGHLTIDPTALGGAALPIPPDILNQFKASIPLGALPFDLRLVSVKVQPTGVTIAATATHVVLPAS